MKQVNKSSTPVKKKRVTKTKSVKRPHPKYGTSKLEKDFEEQFLKKLGLKYVYQFEAKDIGRFYDFAIFTKSGSIVLLEVDGGYFHMDPRVIVSEDQIKPMHKRNKRVDALKDRWALMHGIPIIRVWEKDIRENPKMVMNELKKRLSVINEDEIKKNEKNKRHNNVIS